MLDDWIKMELGVNNLSIINSDGIGWCKNYGWTDYYWHSSRLFDWKDDLWLWIKTAVLSSLEAGLTYILVEQSRDLISFHHAASSLSEISTSTSVKWFSTWKIMSQQRLLRINFVCIRFHKDHRSHKAKESKKVQEFLWWTACFNDMFFWYVWDAIQQGIRMACYMFHRMLLLRMHWSMVQGRGKLKCAEALENTYHI
jgi:hypothetical protein